MIIVALVVAVISVFAVILSIFRPERVLAIYIVSRPIMQPFIFLQYKFFIVPYSVIWAAILPVIYVIQILRGSWTFLCYKSIPLFIVLLIGILSIPFTVDIKASIEGVLKLITVFCSFGLAYNSVKNVRNVDMLINATAVASIVPLLFGFYQEATGNYSQVHTAVVERVNSVFGVGNAYGIFLSITMCAAFMVILNKKITQKKRMAFIALLCCMITSQILALNRGTWLALSAAIIISLVPYRNKINVKLFVIGAIVILVAFSGVIYDRFTEDTYRWNGEKRDTFQGRIDYWKGIIPVIMARPILGYGIGTTGETREINGLLAPHNDYVRLASDIGIIGSIVYIYFLVSLALYYLRKRNIFGDDLLRYNFPMAVLSCYIVIISLTQNIIFNLLNFVFFMILNGAVIKLNILERKKRNEYSTG